ncbi:MAG: hypothetical protein AB7I79_16070 [Rhizobiaceae bacterium]
MKSGKAAAILSALLYGQALFGILAVGAVLMKERTDIAAVDPMTVASVHAPMRSQR